MAKPNLQTMLQRNLPSLSPRAHKQASSGGTTAPESGTMTQKQIAELWIAEKGDPKKADLASAVSMAESGGKVQAHTPGSCCHGLWQLNTEVGVSNERCANNAVCATRYAIHLSQNGTNWQPWEAFTNGSYKKFLGKSGIEGSEQGCQPFGGNQLGTVAAGAAAGAAAGTVVPIGGNIVGGLIGAGIGAGGAFLGSNTLGGCSPVNTENLNPLSPLELVGKSIAAIAKLIEDLFTAHFWIRFGKGLLGALLIIYALQGMTKAVFGVELPNVGPLNNALRASIRGSAGK